MALFLKHWWEIFKPILFLSIGVVILWTLYKDMLFDKDKADALKKGLSTGVHYEWLILSSVLLIISQFFRAARWLMLIRSTGNSPPFWKVFWSVLFGYLMNLTIPRSGEISRCAPLSRSEKISFSKLIGTVVTERILDMLMALLIIGLTFLVNIKTMASFMSSHSTTNTFASNLIIYTLLFSVILVILIITYWYIIGKKYHSSFWKTVKKNHFISKIIGTIQKIWLGIISVKKVEKKSLFIFHTFAIWGLYFLMTYTAFQAFDFTSSFGWKECLFIFTMGNIGMVLPVPGGIGAFHFFIKEGLKLLGIAVSSGKMYALVVHTILTFLGTVIPGILSLFFIVTKKKS